jgi:hypothetical protein
MYSREFYFVAVLTWTVKVKNKHISVGLSGCRTIGLSDQRAVGLTGCRIIATLPILTSQIMVLQNYNFLEYLFEIVHVWRNFFIRLNEEIENFFNSMIISKWLYNDFRGGILDQIKSFLIA